MSLDESAVFEAALNLPAERRWELAERLLETLQEPDRQIERAWIDEAQRRLQAVREGTMDTIPADEMLRSIREQLQK